MKLNNITYKILLSDYQPIEEGDFLLQYEIPQGGFIIYSPRKGKLSCVEMLNFTDVTPIELAVILNKQIPQAEGDEFSIPVVCDKDSLLKYIFDIGFLDTKTQRYTNQIKPFEGYLMKDIADKNRNFFQIGGGESSIVFDNEFTYQSNGKSESNDVFLTFDPQQYERMLNDVDASESTFLCLLSNASNVLFEKLLKEGATLSYMKGDEKPLNLFKLIIYLLNRDKNNSILLELDSKQVFLGFMKDYYSTEEILNLVSRSQSKIRATYGEKYVTSFYMKRTEKYNLVNFRNCNELIAFITKEIFEMFKPNLNLIG